MRPPRSSPSGERALGCFERDEELGADLGRLVLLQLVREAASALVDDACPELVLSEDVGELVAHRGAAAGEWVRIVLDDHRTVPERHQRSGEQVLPGDGEVLSDLAAYWQRAQQGHLDPVEVRELPGVEGVHGLKIYLSAHLGSQPLAGGLVDAALRGHSDSLRPAWTWRTVARMTSSR